VLNVVPPTSQFMVALTFLRITSLVQVVQVVQAVQGRRMEM